MTLTGAVETAQVACELSGVLLERKGRSWSLETLTSKCQPHPVDAEARPCDVSGSPARSGGDACFLWYLSQPGH